MKNLILCCLVLGFSSVAVGTERVKVRWWHAMSGAKKNVIEELVKTYNESQELYEVEAIHKGSYADTLNASIAAFRARKQPHIIQVFEVGTQTMMLSGAIQPVQDLFTKYKVEIDWGDFLGPVKGYYQSADGRLYSMPFNSSTPIMYYNKEIFAKAGLSNPPKTWQELNEYTKKILASGTKCGFTSSWQSWVLLENYSAIRNIPFATNENGFTGLDVKLEVNNEVLVRHLTRLQDWHKDRRFKFQGRKSDPARGAFLSGECAIMMESSSAISSMNKMAKFEWAAAPLPYEEDAPAQNSIIGGATLWVFDGHKDEEYKGVVDFFKHLSSPEVQAWWHQNTGYLPITKTAYKKLKAEGFYEKDPIQEVALQQIMRTETSAFTRGIRLGSFSQLREIINEEMEKIWSGKQTAKQSMDRIVRRGNTLLKNFKRRIR